MSILQIIKGVFSDIFPLHLNSSMDALEEDLTDAELSLYFSGCREEVLRNDLDILRAANHAYRVENSLMRESERAREADIQNLTDDLDEAYKAITPSYTPPFNVHSSVQNRIVRMRLDPVEVSCWLSVDISEWCREGVAHEMAQNLGASAKEAVVQEAYTVILNALSK